MRKIPDTVAFQRERVNVTRNRGDLKELTATQEMGTSALQLQGTELYLGNKISPDCETQSRGDNQTHLDFQLAEPRVHKFGLF